MTLFTNPGPNTRICAKCGDVWFPADVRVNRDTGKRVILASDDDYEVKIICGVCKKHELKQGLKGE